MNSSEAKIYNDAFVKEVFGALSIDKTRLPSSGLTAVGVPSFVAEWLLDKIVPGTGALTASELEKVNTFVRKAFPRKDDRNEIIFDLTQGGSSQTNCPHAGARQARSNSRSDSRSICPYSSSES
jgi:ATP-dependent Lon protease